MKKNINLLEIANWVEDMKKGSLDYHELQTLEPDILYSVLQDIFGQLKLVDLAYKELLPFVCKLSNSMLSLKN